MLTSYAYASVPSDRVEVNVVDQILTSAVPRNRTLGVTGALYSDGETFFHVIEGQEPVLAKLMSRILRDPRHQQVVILDQMDLQDRMFGECAIRHVDGRGDRSLRQMFSYRELVSAGADYAAACVRALAREPYGQRANAPTSGASRLVAIR